MSDGITRRDFLDGALLTIAGATSLAKSDLATSALGPSGVTVGEYYPPALTGLRGSHEGAYEVAHGLAWRGERPADHVDLAEAYDLVVVGAGISGLAAALFYQRKAGTDKKILILDNHDDFGGHAKRNEFHTRAGMLLGPGGSLNLQDYHLYSTVARGLIEDLGFDLPTLRDKTDPAYGFANLGDTPLGLYTDKEHFGKDGVLNGHWIGAWLGHGNYRELVTALPVSDADKQCLLELIAGSRTLLVPIPSTGVIDFLRGTSYQRFLTEFVGLSRETAQLWNTIPSFLFGVGVDSISIREAISMGLPATSVLGETAMKALATEEKDADHGEAPGDGGVVWMPDGNASLARQMVRRLIPEVAPGETVDDLMTAHFDYGQLDRSGQSVRLRLNSTVVNAANSGDGTVSVSYVTDGKAFRVNARHCVLACYNGLIPHLCPELPEAQKEHLRYGVKTPLVVANVLVRNGHAFRETGSDMYFCPTSYFSAVSTTPNTNIGAFKPATGADEPMLIYMLRGLSAMNDGTQSARDLYRVGRHALYTMDFSDYEREIRGQLTGMFGAVGFDPNRDIEAITVNRWSHGYAYEYMDLFDPEWPEGQAPHELGRTAFGRISIANSDSEAYAYVNAAIDAAWRAVNEQLAAT